MLAEKSKFWSHALTIACAKEHTKRRSKQQRIWSALIHWLPALVCTRMHSQRHTPTEAHKHTCMHICTYVYTHACTCLHTQSLCIYRSLQRGEASSSACDQAATFLTFASAAASPAIQAACQGSGDPDQPGMVFSGDKLVPLASWKGASLGHEVRSGSTVTTLHYDTWLLIKLTPKGCSTRKNLHKKFYTKSTKLKALQ